MQMWNNIIQNAMLGTDKKLPDAADFSAALTVPLELINGNISIDKEEKFLQSAALVFNYRQCGVLPLHKEGIDLAIAPSEENAYCNKNAVQALKDILNEDSAGLLAIWLQRCSSRQLIVPPGLVPMLFTKAEKNTALQSLVQICCGKRGSWLAQFNPAWMFFKTATPEDTWQTGTPDERKKLLQRMLAEDGGTARQWLKQTWAQENVNSKTGFLAILPAHAGDDDIEWLETILAEKNQKVKEAALAVLKQLPSSSITKKYWQVLQQAVQLKKEKALFGLTTKTTLSLQLPAITDEEIFKTGIEKLSSQKEFSDDEYILLQLIQSVPPALWETHFGATPEGAIHYFQQQETAKKFLPALVVAISQFKDKRWAWAMMKESGLFYIDTLPLLPVKEQELYSNKYFTGYETSIISYATERKEAWGIELTKNIFRFTASNPYQYNRSFYNKNIHLIPVQIIGELQNCTPAEAYSKSTWANTSEYIKKLLELKFKTMSAFE